MTWGVTGYKTGSSTNSVASVSQTITATSGGETILVFGNSRVTTWAATPVSDNLSSTYVSVYNTASTTATVERQLCYVLENAPSGITSITLTKSAANTNGLSLIVAVVTGASLTGQPDRFVSAGASSASTSLASGTSAGSITATSEIIFGCGSVGNTATFSAQAFGGTAATYGSWNDLGTQSDGSSPESINVGWATLSGGTLGTISFSSTSSANAGWVAGAVTLIPATGYAASGTGAMHLAGAGTAGVIVPGSGAGALHLAGTGSATFGAYTGPQLATGGSRIYNLPDIIANLNDDVNQANAPDLTDTTAFTNLVSAFEQATMVDTPIAAAYTAPKWGIGQWGLTTWS